jgi:hypothetical protein
MSYERAMAPPRVPGGNLWEQADLLLSQAQELVDQMLIANDDRYQLLASAKEHIVMARSDLDADLK